MAIVAIIQRDKIEAAITEALELLDVEGLFRNKVVAIHPNDTWASREDKTAVTDGASLYQEVCAKGVGRDRRVWGRGDR